MVFQFFKNRSDNRYLNKDLKPVSVSANPVLLPFALNSTFTYLRNDGLGNVGFTPVSADEIDSYWNGSPGIGNCGYFTQKIDLTDINAVSFDVVTGTCYGGGETVYDVTWALQVGFQRNAPTIDVININDAAWLVATDFINSNTDYGNVTLDTSNITGEAYLCLYCHGMNASIKYMVFDTVEMVYDANVIYKSDVAKDDLNLELAYSQSIYENANYALCVDTGYYFYLSEPTLAAQRLFFNCEVDLLMTYKDDILNLGCILSRQENTFNTYIKDTQQAILSKRVVDTRIAPHGFNTNDQFILATCGK